MNRWIILSLAATLVGSGAISSVYGPVKPVADPPVNLQAATPGTQQVGNANISGKLLAGTVSATATGAGGQAIYGIASAGSGLGYGGLFKCASPSGTGVRGYATAGSGFGYGGDFQSDGPSGTAVRGLASSTTGFNYGVYGKTNSSSGRGVFGLASSTASGFTYGGDFESAGRDGRGVRGTASSPTGYTFGGYFTTTSDKGNGVFADASSPTRVTYGGRFYAESVAGTALYAEATSSSGLTSAGRFFCSSPDGVAVTGISASYSGLSYGGYFKSYGSEGRGIFTAAYDTDGANYGIRAQSNSGTNGYGVYSIGRTGASGTKSFRIDHPLDPANRYLSHYSAEGPEPLNIYRGTVVTDAQGYAWVSLPNYFESINKDPSYQLTVISGDFVQAIVSKKFENGRFQIRTNKPKTEVCWRVEACRNDAFVRAYGAPVETTKPDSERGRYQHPELYGKPKELGMDYVPERDANPGQHGPKLPKG